MLFPTPANSLIPTRLSDTQTSIYDAPDRTVSATRPDTATRTYTWNRRNQLSAFEEPGGQDWSLNYDGNGNLSAVTDPLQREHRYERDAEDRVQALKTTVDGTERVTSVNYDAEGRVIKVTDPENVSAAYEYDAEGRLQHTYDAQNRLTATFGYDARGNHAFSTDALGRTAALRYDGLDRVTELEDPLQRVTELDYDEADRLRSGRLVSDDPLVGGHSTQTFDSRDRLMTREGPPATVTASGFSAAAALPEDGNVFSTVPSDNGDRFTWYSNGLLKEERNAGGLVAKWTYNSRGLPDAVLNGRAQKRTFEWDVNGRLKSFSDPDGTVEYEYDISGNMLSSKRGSGIIITDPAPLTTQSADSTKGIKRRAAADTGSGGRLLRTAAGDAEEPVDVSRTYDALHRVTGYTNPAGETIGYEYDNAGNLYKLSYPDGKTVTYLYDKADRLTSVTDWAQRKTVYHYDANGRLEKTERPNGTVQQREYDAAGQLTLLEDLDAWDNVIVRFRYFYNAAGEIVRESMEPESAVFNVSLPLNMAYGDYNRLALWNGQDVAFDADNNLTYGPLGGGFADFEYDSRNRLTKAGDIEYIYDAEDTRVAAVDNGQRTDYTVDPNSTLSRLLIKTDPDGGKTYYVYGLGLIGEESGGQYTAYHFDYRGSTVALTDLNGGVTERFGYSPYGVLMSGDASRTPFLFNGMYGVMSDANGLYYMRARFYHPQLRRFLNLDPLHGDVVDGQNLNRFVYAKGNPVSYVDPNGELPILIVVGACAVLWVGTEIIFADMTIPEEHAGDVIAQSTIPDCGAGTAISGLLKGARVLAKGMSIAGRQAARTGSAVTKQLPQEILSINKVYLSKFLLDSEDGIAYVGAYHVDSGIFYLIRSPKGTGGLHEEAGRLIEKYSRYFSPGTQAKIMGFTLQKEYGMISVQGKSSSLNFKWDPRWRMMAPAKYMKKLITELQTQLPDKIVRYKPYDLPYSNQILGATDEYQELLEFWLRSEIHQYLNK